MGLIVFQARADGGPKAALSRCMADFGEGASVVAAGDFPSRTPEEPRLIDGALRVRANRGAEVLSPRPMDAAELPLSGFYGSPQSCLPPVVARAGCDCDRGSARRTTALAR